MFLSNKDLINNNPYKWTREELINIKHEYKEKLRQLQLERKQAA